MVGLKYDAASGDNLIQLGYSGNIEAVVGRISAFQEQSDAVTGH